MSNRSSIFTNEIVGLPVSFIDLKNQTNDVFFVNSANGVDSSGYGSSPDVPFATIDYAIGNCVATKGDTIFVMPGHTESGITVTADISNINIIGLGNGTKRPTLTFSATGNKITISADSVKLENLILLTGIDSVVNKVLISGNGCQIKNCIFEDVTNVETITDISITGNDCTIENVVKKGYTAGDANVRVISANGARNLKIKDCDFFTKVTTAVVGFVTGACYNVTIENCNFLVTGTINLSKNIVDTVSGSVWSCKINNFDIGAGANFSGGSGKALS